MWNLMLHSLGPCRMFNILFFFISHIFEGITIQYSVYKSQNPHLEDSYFLSVLFPNMLSMFLFFSQELADPYTSYIFGSFLPIIYNI